MEISRQLPDHVAELQAMLSAQLLKIDALALERDAFKIYVETLKSERNALKVSRVHDGEEIKRLTELIAKLRRAMFGQKSEKRSAQIDQFELELEELHITQGTQPQLT